MLRVQQGNIEGGHCCNLSRCLPCLESEERLHFLILYFSCSCQEPGCHPPPVGRSVSVFPGTNPTPRPCFYPSGCGPGKRNATLLTCILKSQMLSSATVKAY